MLSILLNYYLSISDAGRLKPIMVSNNDKHITSPLVMADYGANALEDDEYLQLLAEQPPQNICYDCRLMQTERSRHCQFCNVCVDVFDHHCPWVNNCIGVGNYHAFIIYLVVQSAFICLLLWEVSTFAFVGNMLSVRCVRELSDEVVKCWDIPKYSNWMITQLTLIIIAGIFFFVSMIHLFY